jgi:hypothetical protein
MATLAAIILALLKAIPSLESLVATALKERAAARAAAPEWCRDALKTINALETDLERR